MGLTRQEKLDRVWAKATGTKLAHELAVALNNRVPTLKCANGARVAVDGSLIVPQELAERIIRVLDGDESAKCRKIGGVEGARSFEVSS